MKKIRIFIFLLLLIIGYYPCAQAHSYLRLDSVKEQGLLLMLSDGSEWEIKYFGGAWKLLGWGWTEQQEVSHWTVGDEVEIQYPASGNIIDFVLTVNNLSRSEKALAILKQAPSVDHPACLWIVDFDNETQLVTLNDGTLWTKTAADMLGAFIQQKPSSQHEWKIGDPLTLIRGEGWLNSHSFCLWNHSVNEMPYVERH